VEPFKGEYALAIMMSAKNTFFCSCAKCHMCGDYCPMNEHTCSNKYVMPLSKEIFDALGQAKVFNTMDLRYGYHQLPLKEGNKVNTTFWGIDPYQKDYLYQWRFLSFDLKNIPTKFQRVMD
jgi:hypothetical protein